MLTLSKLEKAIDKLYRDHCCSLPGLPENEPAFDPPVVAVADAGDPLFLEVKQVIGDHHWLPDEALRRKHPGAAARSVIVWSLPVAERARRTNRDEMRTPSLEWAYVRTYGEKSNETLRAQVVKLLEGQGHHAAAPQLMMAGNSEFFPATDPDFPDLGLSSCWSERHTAFVAGLGTFGISGGLITRHGIAHRLGSVVTDLELSPSDREYGDNPFAWCLKTAEGSCGKCITRCPAGSIGVTHEARNKSACGRYAYNHISSIGRELYGWEGTYGCGLCQTGVPCEFEKPL
jgi:epoxyqueuosine reductase